VDSALRSTAGEGGSLVPGLHGRLWRINETCIRVNGEWKWLFRAINKHGRTIDFLLTHRRNAKAAPAVSGEGAEDTPELAAASHQHRQEPGLWRSAAAIEADEPNVGTIEHRQAKYLNNRIEADHGPTKRLCRATLGFKSMKTAYATIKGFEVMRMIRKRQCILAEPGVTGEVRFAKLLGVPAC
jgi:transposase-like protein